MFKTPFILCVLFAVVYCYDDPANIEASVLKYNNGINPDGSYAYEYATSNGVDVVQTGIGSSYASGTYAYTSPEGQPIKVSYLADENGYQPSGDHLPTPPPIPDYILRSLEYIQAHPFVKASVNRK